MTPEPLLTARQLAERLNLPIESIWKLARDGRFPSYKVPGGRSLRRFSWPEIESVLRGGNNGKVRA